MEDFFQSVDKQNEGLFVRLVTSYHSAASSSLSAILQSLISWRKRSMLDWTNWTELGCTTSDSRTQPLLDEKKIVRSSALFPLLLCSLHITIEHDRLLVL